MGMNPASQLCDRFYEALIRFNIPLLVHAGDEHAVPVEGLQFLGNPLVLRRPLDQGVRVIIAPCASLVTSDDIDKGENGPEVSNFELFKRLMADPAYRQTLYGDISAVTQVNRDVSIISEDRKSTRLNSSHSQITYAFFCLKKIKEDRVACLIMLEKVRFSYSIDKPAK